MAGGFGPAVKWSDDGNGMGRISTKTRGRRLWRVRVIVTNLGPEEQNEVTVKIASVTTNSSSKVVGIGFGGFSVCLVMSVGACATPTRGVAA